MESHSDLRLCLAHRDLEYMSEGGAFPWTRRAGDEEREDSPAPRSQCHPSCVRKCRLDKSNREKGSSGLPKRPRNKHGLHEPMQAKGKRVWKPRVASLPSPQIRTALPPGHNAPRDTVHSSNFPTVFLFSPGPTTPVSPEWKLHFPHLLNDWDVLSAPLVFCTVSC